jgi:spermidine synthase/tetratricopeptide (TPR) repeat protein/MFS family permease
MSKNTLYGIIAVLFIVSGAAGLVYQIVWFKYLSLFLGNTTYAQTIVLATFMGGLAIGASLWGRRADRAERPLALYAILELSIGVYCLLYPFLLNLFKEGFVSVVQSSNLPSDSTAVLLLKLLVSILTLLLPTILMGGTLPVLVRFISHSVEESGKNVATLYFLNSFGAVVGSLLGGFFLVPIEGLHATITATGVANVAIGGIALALASLRFRVEPEPAVSEAMPAGAFSDLQVSFAVAVAGVSGLASMIYEVSWVRMLIPVLGSSTYSYTLMLVAFISGITIGSWLVSVSIHRIRNLVGALAFCQLGVGLSMAAMLPLYGLVPYYFWHAAAILTRTEFTYPIYLAIQFVVGFAIMIVPTIFLGMSLPLASRIATRSVMVLGRSVGNVFSVNTVGTVIGALSGGLLLIPLVGVRHAIEVGLILNLLAGMMLLFFHSEFGRWKRVATLLGAAIATGAYFSFTTNWNQTVLLSGIFRQFGKDHAPPSSYKEFLQATRANKAIFYKEGASATVGVIQTPTRDGTQKVLLINGKGDASSVGDLPTQVLLGQVPMLFHPHSDSVLVIGYGSGVTAGSVLTHPVSFVQSVEISPEVIEASTYFEDVNNHPLQDPRMKLTIDDALAFLKLTRANYDVIISEPSNPWIAGIGNLYTVEFFTQCDRRLKNDGVMVQWFHLYEIDDETFRLVVRTFHSVFPHVTIWQSEVADVLLIGSKEPLVFNEEALGGEFDLPSVRADLKRIEIPDVATLLSLQMLSDERVADYAGSGAFNTEDRPLLEYWAPRAFFVDRGANEINRFDERRTFAGSTIFLKQRTTVRPLTDEERLHIGLLHADENRGNPLLGYSMLVDYLRRHPRDVPALEAMAELTERLGRGEEYLAYLERLVELHPNDPVILEKYAWLKYSLDRPVASSFAPYSAEVSERLLKRCVELTADTVDYYRAKLGDLYFGIQQFRPALENYRRALQIRENYDPDKRLRQDGLLLQLAKCYRHLAENGRAISYALQAVALNPKNEEAKNLFYLIWTQGNSRNRDSSRSKQ